MSALQGLLLGLLQGLTEFLPVSSSAHLILFQDWFGISEPDLLFSVLVHLGTLAAIFIAFRKTIASLFGEVIQLGKKAVTGKVSFRESSEQRKLLFWLLLSLIPLFFVYPFKSLFDPLLVSPLIAGICLLFNSFVLLLCDMAPSGKKTADETTWFDALFVGVMQCAAILPGLSRSGTTITAGICRGMKRSFAAKYSFLLSIPTILGGALLELIDALKEGIDPANLPAYLIGMGAAALSGLLALRLLKKILRSKRFVYFALYTFAIGIAALVFSAT